ncbi:hydroxymethylbilane synthase [Chitinimonas arctica]|uniref:Hydroxymethylbilane synthase n=1 Tax=Chitinimonas arctica TaxID=2594795 RepID=A0A516SE78_9NEIS|nr:hydroxymethylbilane synthase [Chitinimonas arctica]QDQ26451.1 hydroxymethylbilane synthase [Chitinimonas arctica]
MSLPDRLVIATQEFALASWQARHIAARLQARYPGLRIDLLDVSGGSADVAVHAMTDMPMRLPDGFVLAVVTEREDPRDAFVSNRHATLADLPPAAVVGISDPRCEAQIRAAFPHLRVAPLLGDVHTHLAELDDGQYDAIILAAASLKGLGLAERIRTCLSTDECLPAPGQGALGLVIPADRPELAVLLAPLNHAETADCVAAERAMSLRLDASCETPLGGFAEVLDEYFLRMRGFVARPDGSEMLRAESNGSRAAAVGLGRQVADLMLTEGARALLIPKV